MWKLVDRNKTVLITKYHDEIKPYLKDINNLQKSDTWDIQLTIAINFVSYKDTEEEREMHSRSDNMKKMIYDKGDKVIEELFESFLSKCQISLETQMGGSDFIFEYVTFPVGFP